MEKYSVDTDSFGKAVQTTETVTKVVTSRAGKYVDVILLLSVCALEILFTFVSLSIARDVSIMEILCTFSESIVNIVVFYIFIKPGKNGRCAQDTYTTAYKTWRDTCRNLRDNGLLGAFRDFCRACTTADEEATKKAAIERLENLYVTLADYEGSEKVKGYRSYTRKELRALKKSGVISAQAYRQILKCNKPVKVVPYNANLILDGSEKAQIERGLKKGDKYEAIGISLRPFTCFLLTVVTKAIQIAQEDIKNPLAIAVSILFTIFGICFAAFMGYRFGWNCIGREQKYIETRTSFLDRFLEENKKGATRPAPTPAPTPAPAEQAQEARQIDFHPVPVSQV